MQEEWLPLFGRQPQKSRQEEPTNRRWVYEDPNCVVPPEHSGLLFRGCVLRHLSRSRRAGFTKDSLRSIVIRDERTRKRLQSIRAKESSTLCTKVRSDPVGSGDGPNCPSSLGRDVVFSSRSESAVG